jgi:hypothetical protein
LDAKRRLDLEYGAAVFYSLDNENSSNKLYVYPKFNAFTR